MFILVAGVYVGSFITVLKPFQQRVSEYMTVTFLGIATSILTLAVAYLFSGHESAKTLAWIIEASLIFTVYARYMNPWILVGAIVVQIVAMGQFVMMSPSIPANLTVFVVVLATSFWNIWSLRNISTQNTWSAEIVLFVSTCIWYGFLALTLSAENNWSI